MIKEKTATSDKTNNENIVQETKTFNVYDIPIELTNNNSKFAELVEEITIKQDFMGENAHILNFVDHGLPIWLAITLNGRFKSANEVEEQFITNVLSVYQDIIYENFIEVYSIIDPCLVTKLWDYVSVLDIPTNSQYIEELIKSSTREPYPYCYDYGLPKLQELFKMKIALPNDLTMDGEPFLHYLITEIGYYNSPIDVIVSNYPNINYYMTNSKGYSIFQEAIISGRKSTLQFLVDNVPNNPKEVTDNNETWVDLACRLPRYDTYFSDVQPLRYNTTRKYVIEQLAPKFGIVQNISLTNEIYYDSNQPTSLKSIQAKIMEINKNYIPIIFFFS